MNSLAGPSLWAPAWSRPSICLYTLRGGLRAVAWTDLFQGIIMFAVLSLALVIIAGKVGGLSQAGTKLLAQHPELFSRPGGLGKYAPGIWLSFIFLWFFCDPMFPQLFQRFLAAKDDRVIRRTMIFYPFICSAVFLLPVTIGVLGHLEHPGLTGKAADSILPLLAAGMGQSGPGGADRGLRSGRPDVHHGFPTIDPVLDFQPGHLSLVHQEKSGQRLAGQGLCPASGRSRAAPGRQPSRNHPGHRPPGFHRSGRAFPHGPVRSLPGLEIEQRGHNFHDRGGMHPWCWN